MNELTQFERHATLRRVAEIITEFDAERDFDCSFAPSKQSLSLVMELYELGLQLMNSDSIFQDRPGTHSMD